MGRTTLLQGALGVACTLLIAACGGGGSGGNHGTGAGGASGNGGEAGQGGSGPVDTKPPDFSGAKTAKTRSETRVELAWDPAKDDLTSEARIAYAVYVGTKPGAEDFAAPQTIVPAGATGALLSGLNPATTYYFVVRAIDEAGNEDANTVEQSAQTPDESAPRFAGITKLTASTS